MSKNKMIIEIWNCSKLATIIESYWKDTLIAGMTPTCLNECSTTPGMLLISLRIVPRSISCQISNRALMSSWTVLGGLGSHRMRWSMMSQRCSMGFIERPGQSFVSIPSSSKNRWHTLSTWNRVLSCNQEYPRTDCTSVGSNNSSKDLVSVPTYNNCNGDIILVWRWGTKGPISPLQSHPTKTSYKNDRFQSHLDCSISLAYIAKWSHY